MDEMMDVEIKLLQPAFSLQCPTYATKGSAAMDLRACIHTPVCLEPGESRLIPTGIAIHIANPCYAGMILPRSGLGSKGIVIGNLVGLIDSDYQGELMVNVWNRNTASDVRGDVYSSYRINHGDRIAQLVIVPIALMRPIFVDEFSADTDRGSGAFGSTGR